jgi:hypothetical protein
MTSQRAKTRDENAERKTQSGFSQRRARAAGVGVPSGEAMSLNKRLATQLSGDEQITVG